MDSHSASGRTASGQGALDSASRGDISKNYYMRPECPVHQTLRTLRTLTVTLYATSAGPHVRRRFAIYPCVLDVHHQAHASRCPQTLSSPASRRPPSWASISKKSVYSRRIGIESGRRKSVWSILSAQPTLRWPQHDGCILVRWVQYNPHPVRPVHLDGPFHSLISRRNPG